MAPCLNLNIPKLAYSCDNSQERNSVHMTRFVSKNGTWLEGTSRLGCANLFLNLILVFCTGYYVYIETSWQSPNDTAVLYSPNVPTTSGKPNNMVCLQFWYHMHGQHVDTLNLFMKQGQQLPPSPIWTKSGTQGNRWRLGQIAVTSTTPFQVGYWGYDSVFAMNVRFVRWFCLFPNFYGCLPYKKLVLAYSKTLPNYIETFDMSRHFKCMMTVANTRVWDAYTYSSILLV